MLRGPGCRGGIVRRYCVAVFSLLTVAVFVPSLLGPWSLAEDGQQQPDVMPSDPIIIHRGQLKPQGHEGVNVRAAELHREVPKKQDVGGGDTGLTWPDDYRCSRSRTNATPTIVCDGSTQSDIVVFTTMYYDTKNLFVFNASLTLWPDVRRRVRLVLVLPDDSLYRFAGDMLRRACARGWTIILAPQCNADDFPVLSAMFEGVARLWDAAWYGYVNGDVIIARGLDYTLDFLRGNRKIAMPHLVVGRRNSVALSATDAAPNLHRLSQLAASQPFDKDDAEDYFFVMRDQFPWSDSDIPPLVVGRPGYDNWLVWWSQHVRHLNVVDVSFGLTAVHVTAAGAADTSHRRRQHETGFDYNERLTGELGIAWDYFKGCSSRTSHVIHYSMNTSQNLFGRGIVTSAKMEAHSWRTRTAGSSRRLSLFTRYNKPNAWKGTVPPNLPPNAKPPPTKMLKLLL